MEVDGGDESIDAMAPDSILILFLVTKGKKPMKSYNWTKKDANGQHHKIVL